MRTAYAHVFQRVLPLGCGHKKGGPPHSCCSWHLGIFYEAEPVKPLLVTMRAISSLLSGAHAVLPAGPFNLCDDDAHSWRQIGNPLLRKPSCRQHIDRFAFNLLG